MAIRELLAGGETEKTSKQARKREKRRIKAGFTGIYRQTSVVRPLSRAITGRITCINFKQVLESSS